ncbi:nucleotidyltransferase family protein [Pseudanabaena sp. PCC 6802]|uniref:nucleotidyltransferase family protein n=1 Tax=Pseudanabaena sp. PCC 6802 TaxID=118173 RepID=UPI0003643EDB|nr:nucleotidyltransferase domain-containing protein [Pseudanabaena sp. PCC 6802]
MPPQSMHDPNTSYPRSQTRTAFAWEGKYDEQEQHPKVDIAVSAVPMQLVFQRLNATLDNIASFCKKWQIAEIALFGSVLRDDFRVNGEHPSDVDVLFTYDENARKNLILQARMKHELEDLFARKVDLVSKSAILVDPNYIRRQNILGSAKIIYAEG